MLSVRMTEIPLTFSSHFQGLGFGPQLRALGTSTNGAKKLSDTGGYTIDQLPQNYANVPRTDSSIPQQNLPLTDMQPLFYSLFLHHPPQQP